MFRANASLNIWEQPTACGMHFFFGGDGFKKIIIYDAFLNVLFHLSVRFLGSHHAHLYPPRGLLPPPGEVGPTSLPTENRGESTHNNIAPSALSQRLDFPSTYPAGGAPDFKNVTQQKFQRNPAVRLIQKRLILFCSGLAPQAAVFLVVGIVFMIGSLSLIVLDWIHNPPGSSGGH